MLKADVTPGESTTSPSGSSCRSSAGSTRWSGAWPRNVVVYGCLRAGYEAAVLCRGAGVKVADLAKVIEQSADTVGGPMMLMGRPADPLSDPSEGKLREYVRSLMIKDLEAAQELAATLGVALPLVELTLRTDRAVVGVANVNGEKT
jgi:3-hydroxyisobutyrate dehydrogenase